MTTVAKFKLRSILRQMLSRYVKNSQTGQQESQIMEVRTVDLAPVYSDDPSSENGRFWQASPNGKLELACVNKAAVEGMELDREYYVIITDDPAVLAFAKNPTTAKV